MGTESKIVTGDGCITKGCQGKRKAPAWYCTDCLTEFRQEQDRRRGAGLPPTTAPVSKDRVSKDSKDRDKGTGMDWDKGGSKGQVWDAARKVWVHPDNRDQHKGQDRDRDKDKGRDTDKDRPRGWQTGVYGGHKSGLDDDRVGWQGSGSGTGSTHYGAGMGSGVGLVPNRPQL